MSKTSAKQRLTQLKEWLEWRANSKLFKQSATTNKFSKADHYKNTRERYGNKNIN